MLHRAPWQTIAALVEQASNVATQEEDARNWWLLQPLNQSFLDTFPDKVRQAIAGYTNSTTLALSDSDRFGPWQAGWRTAFLWANFQVTADQRFFAVNKEAVRLTVDRLISHLGTFDNRLVWWLKIGHILMKALASPRPPKGFVRSSILSWRNWKHAKGAAGFISFWTR